MKTSSDSAAHNYHSKHHPQNNKNKIQYTKVNKGLPYLDFIRHRLLREYQLISSKSERDNITNLQLITMLLKNFSST